jgi:hypothetical protein
LHDAAGAADLDKFMALGQGQSKKLGPICFFGEMLESGGEERFQAVPEIFAIDENYCPFIHKQKNGGTCEVSPGYKSLTLKVKRSCLLYT